MTSQKLSSYFLAAALMASVAAGTAAQGQEIPIPPLANPVYGTPYSAFC